MNELSLHHGNVPFTTRQLAQRITVGDGIGPIGTSDGGDGRSLLDHAEAGLSAPGNRRKDGTSTMSTNASSKNVDEEEAMLSKDIHRTMSTMTELIATRMAPAAERTGRPQHSLLVKRYREILFDCGADFSKTSAAVARKREARELFRGATSSSSGGAGGGDASTEQLLRERNAIDNSMKSANSVLGQAANVRSELRAQGASLRGVTGTMAQIAGNVPGLNGLMDMIRKKRQQDDRVVGGVVAGCILFTLWYLFG